MEKFIENTYTIFVNGETEYKTEYADEECLED